jgi:hypothetical protein
MVAEHRFDIYSQKNLVRLTEQPTKDVLEAVTETPISDDGTFYKYYCKPNDFSSRKFYKWNGYEWEPYDSLYGIYVELTGTSVYSTVAISSAQALWSPVDTGALQDFDLTEYLPMAWWTLFIIPYVAFKFAIRNGDDGNLFADEFTQGFQQLQSNYNIPNTVVLATVAGKPAYANIVKENLHNLTVKVSTRAIFDDMRVGTGIQRIFGGFYDAGGWGV